MDDMGTVRTAMDQLVSDAKLALASEFGFTMGPQALNQGIVGAIEALARLGMLTGQTRLEVLRHELRDSGDERWVEVAPGMYRYEDDGQVGKVLSLAEIVERYGVLRVEVSNP